MRHFLPIPILILAIFQLILIPNLVQAQPDIRTINGETSSNTQSWNQKLQNLASKIVPYTGWYSDEEFRPFIPGDEETPAPTLVELYLRDLQVTNVYNTYTNRAPPTARLDLAGDLVMEYSDPRRSFDSSEINGASYIRLPNSARIWTPALRSYSSSGASVNWTLIQADVTSYQIPSLYSSRELLVSSSGRIFKRVPITVQGILGTETVSEGVYKFQISPQVHTLDEVKLSWRGRNPVEVLPDGNGRLPGVTTGSCRRTEDDGSFGVRKFACLELTVRIAFNYGGMTMTPSYTATPVIG